MALCLADRERTDRCMLVMGGEGPRMYPRVTDSCSTEILYSFAPPPTQQGRPL